jgi:hypothetical protein
MYKAQVSVELGVYTDAGVTKVLIKVLGGRKNGEGGASTLAPA